MTAAPGDPHDEPFARESLAVLGGPTGRYASPRARSAAYAVAGLVLAAALTMAAAVLLRGHCLARGWNGDEQFARMCFSDLTSQYQLVGLSRGLDAWLDPAPGAAALEQPPLTAALMALVGGLIPGAGILAQTQGYFALWALITTALVMATVWFTGDTVAAPGTLVAPLRRPALRAAHVALCPVVALATLLSADVLGVALASAGLWAWSRRRPGLAGVLLGLAVLARSYPLLLVAAVLLVAPRSGRRGDGWFTAAVAALTAVLTALPLLVWHPQALLAPYRAWWRTEPGLGGLQRVPELFGYPLSPTAGLALAVAGWLVAVLAAVAVCARAGRAPSVAELGLVMVGIVLLTAKSWPIQASLWLVPLVALAGVRWRDHLVWAAGEAAHYVALWLYMDGTVRADRGLPPAWYAVAVLLRTAVLVWVLVQTSVGSHRLQPASWARHRPAPAEDWAGASTLR